MHPNFRYLKDVAVPPFRLKHVKQIPRDFIQQRFQPYIQFEIEVWELNLRVIDSYLPELLYLLAQAEKLEWTHVLFTDEQTDQRILKYKYLKFIEALLFSNLFDGVWKGNWDSTRCYVLKEHGELKFYSMLERSPLIEMLYAKMQAHLSSGYLKISFAL